MSTKSRPAGRITEIRDQVRDPERVSLFVEGDFCLGLPKRVLLDEGLRVGQVLTEEDVDRLAALDAVSRAKESAVRLLGVRPRSRRELEDRLARKGFDETTISIAIERMEELGYVDDEDFARFWIENRVRNRPRGKRLMASELRNKGVSKSAIDSALAETEIDEVADAINLARRRSSQLSGLDRTAWRRRMTGYLQRRGFGWDAIKSALATVEQETDE